MKLNVLCHVKNIESLQVSFTVNQKTMSHKSRHKNQIIISNIECHDSVMNDYDLSMNFIEKKVSEESCKKPIL